MKFFSNQFQIVKNSNSHQSLEKLDDKISIHTSAPNLWVLENETSKELQSAMNKK